MFGAWATINQQHNPVVLIVAFGQGIFMPRMGAFMMMLPVRHVFDLEIGMYSRRSAIGNERTRVADRAFPDGESLDRNRVISIVL